MKINLNQAEYMAVDWIHLTQKDRHKVFVYLLTDSAFLPNTGK